MTKYLAIFLSFLFSTVSIAQPTGPFGPIGQSYVVPASGEVLFVASNGSGSNYTLSNPGSLSGALAAASTNTTIVLRGGTYRIGSLSYNKKLTLQPYLNETPILKGSELVTNWVASGNEWKVTWNTLFPRSAPSFENGNKSLWNLDMVIVGGQPLTQVEALSQVTSGKFYINYTTKEITFGTNPSGKTLELTAHAVGLTRMTGSGGNVDAGTISGLTFMHYAEQGFTFGLGMPQSNVPYNTYGAVIPNGVFENNRFIFNGKSGARICGDDVIIKNNEFGNNGFVGVDIQNANRALVEGNWVHHNNYQKIPNFPGGIKVFNQCDAVRVYNNLVEENNGNGVWFDVGHTNSVVVHNRMKNNSKANFMFEICSGIIIAGNEITGDGGNAHGILIMNGAYAKIYNNTFFGSKSSITIKRNHRSSSNDQFGWHASTGPDAGNYEHNYVGNNLMTQTYNGTGLLSIVESGDGCGADPDDQIDYSDYNGYFRVNSSSPTNAILWAPNPGGACQSGYTSINSFRNSHPAFDEHSLDIVGGGNPFFVNAGNRDFRLKDGSVAIGAGAPLPADVAQALGWSQNRIDLGAYQRTDIADPGRSPYAGVIQIPGTIQAENYDIGGQNVSYYDTSAGNTGGFYRYDAVDLGEVAAGNYCTGWSANGEWQEYTINVASAGLYKIDFRYASGTTGAKIGAEIIGGNVLISALDLPQTVSWNDYEVKGATNITLPAGQNILRINTVVKGFNLDKIDITSLQPAATIEFVAPTSNQQFNAPANVYVKVDASVSGGINNVKLYLNNTLVRQENGAPYEWGLASQNDVLLQNMVSGNYGLRADVTDNNGNLHQKFSAFSVSGSVQSPYNGIIQLPGTIEAENYDNGGQDISYSDTSSGNTGGVYRTSDDVDVQSISGGGFQVAWIETDEWLEYTVNIPTTGSYNFKFHYSTPNANCLVGASLPNEGTTLFTGCDFATTGNWTIPGSRTRYGVTLQAGQHVLRINIEAGGLNIDRIEISEPLLKSGSINDSKTEDINQTELVAYPNPSSNGFFQLNYETRWEAFSMDGRKIKNGESSHVDLSAFPAGSYFLKSNNKVIKLVKQ